MAFASSIELRGGSRVRGGWLDDVLLDFNAARFRSALRLEASTRVLQSQDTL